MIKLQDFLISKGYLKAGLHTGKYFSLTSSAVMAFQKDSGIQPTGYFGLLSRASAQNKVLVVSADNAPEATISIQSVESSNSIKSSAVLSHSKKILWKTNNYPP